MIMAKRSYPSNDFFKQKTAYEIHERLVGSEMCIRDSRKDYGERQRHQRVAPQEQTERRQE